MKGLYSGISRSVLRGWFDNEEEFLEFCANRFDSVKMMRNIMFDNRNRAEARTYEITDRRYRLLVKLLEMD